MVGGCTYIQLNYTSKYYYRLYDTYKFQYSLDYTIKFIISRKSPQADLQNLNASNDKRLRLTRAGFR